MTDEHVEEFEEIPWSQLIPDSTPAGNRTVMIAGGIVIALVVGVFGAKLLGSGSQPTVVETFSEAVPLSVEVPLETSITSESAPPTTGPAQSVLYAEADLMASITPPSDTVVGANYVATRFVREFFTVDGDKAARPNITALFANGVQLPLPHGQEGLTTYVEWTQVVRSEINPDGLDVTVAFQMLEESAGVPEVFVRSEVLEATIALIATQDGYAVGALPNVSPAASPTSIAAWEGVDSAPQAVIDAAIKKISGFATEGAVIAQEQLSGGAWRIVLLAKRADGLSWPLQVIVPQVP